MRRNGEWLPADPALECEALRLPAASFVTLRRHNGELRGCIGELEARRPLVESVAHNARNAALHDPRFEPVGAEELRDLEIHISVLGPLQPLAVHSREELVAALRPGTDGLLLDDGLHRATFLPAVWASLPDPDRFVRELERKAGLDGENWPLTLRAWRYRVTEIEDRAPLGSYHLGRSGIEV